MGCCATKLRTSLYFLGPCLKKWLKFVKPIHTFNPENNCLPIVLIDVRASKCYISNGRGQKGQTVYGTSVVVGWTAAAGTYIVAFIIGTEVEYLTILQAATTDKQRKGACIATGNKSNGETKPRLTADKLFGE
jgi:hypothetical protein